MTMMMITTTVVVTWMAVLELMIHFLKQMRGHFTVRRKLLIGEYYKTKMNMAFQITLFQIKNKKKFLEIRFVDVTYFPGENLSVFE